MELSEEVDEVTKFNAGLGDNVEEGDNKENTDDDHQDEDVNTHIESADGGSGTIFPLTNIFQLLNKAKEIEYSRLSITRKRAENCSLSPVMESSNYRE